MTAKPQSRAQYPADKAKLADELCLYLTMRLGDLLDEMVLIGGLVPKLLIDQASVPESDQHPGSTDLDIGLALRVLEEERYKEISERLRDLGFHPDENERGRATAQRWVSPEGIRIDFLIPPLDEGSVAGTVKRLEPDFGALVIPGLDLAFDDYEVPEISGVVRDGGKARRRLKVCGPGAFIVLKALAFHLRSERKDAFDLCYVLRYWSGGTKDIADRISALRDAGIPGSKVVPDALAHLAADFASTDHDGPIQVANFSVGSRDSNVEADAYGFVSQLLAQIG